MTTLCARHLLFPLIEGSLSSQPPIITPTLRRVITSSTRILYLNTFPISFERWRQTGLRPVRHGCLLVDLTIPFVLITTRAEEEKLITADRPSGNFDFYVEVLC